MIGSFAVGAVLGGAIYYGKQVFFPSKSNTELREDEIMNDTWEEIWYYNGVKIKTDECEKTPFLLGSYYQHNGIKYLFRLPIGITTESMKKGEVQIKEIADRDTVDIEHYKNDLAYVTVYDRPVSSDETPAELKDENAKWENLWIKTKKGSGDKDNGFEYPALVKMDEWASGQIYTFKMPVGISTHHINQADVTIKEFLGASRIEIASSKKGMMQIKSYLKELPKIVKYENVPREKREELEVVLGKSHKGWKRLRLLGGTHNVFVGGAIGTGKSVAINAMIADLALNYGVSELEMWLVDLKVVELSHLRNLKHVKEYEETVDGMINLIDKLTDIMWDRYDKMKSKGVKKISAYNKIVPKHEQLPYILFVVEEIYEFSASKQANDSKNNYIDKLAVLLSKCRGAGIGAVISSQRLVNTYIPRNISANLMNRLCFKVADEKESKLLTDEKFDATQLRGNGHGCLIDTDKEEFQGFFIDEDEGEVTNLLKKHNLLK